MKATPTLELSQAELAEPTAHADKRARRTQTLRRHAKLSVLAKFTGFGFNYLSIPLAISYVTTQEYGLWLTFNSIFLWLSLLDVSFGNGLRNELVKTLSAKDYATARGQVSTLYAFILLFMGGLVLIFAPTNSFIPWAKLLNTRIPDAEIRVAMLVLLLSFALQTVLKSVHAVLLADQKAGWVSILTMLVNALTLLGIILAKYLLPGSLTVLCVIMGAAPVLIYILVNAWLFATRYRFCAPSWRLVDFRAGAAILRSGGKFFIIQVTTLLMFSSGNLAVSYFEGPESVTAYGICYRNFNIIILLFGTVLGPYWSAFTEAYVRDDKVWIKSSIRNLNKFALQMSVVAVLMLLVSPFVYPLWIGNRVTISFSLSVLMTIYVCTYTHLGVYNYVINGTGKILLQTRVSLLGLLLYIPVLYVNVRVFRLGVDGVIVTSICWNIITWILWKIQSYRLLTHQARGIWNG